MKTFCFALGYVSVFGGAYAQYITGSIAGDTLLFTEDTVIDKNASMDFDTIKIMSPLYLQNNGHIFGDIAICDNCRTYIRNAGTIHGNIQIGNNASLVQVITSNDDIGQLNTSASYELMLYQATDIDWRDIARIATNVNTITIMDSVIYFAPDLYLDARAVTPDIELLGVNSLHMMRNDIVDSEPILRNVTGNGRIILYVDDMDPLYVASAVIRDGDMYAYIVRETDYLKILDNDNGEFLNAIRAQNPSDKLLRNLDAATNMSQIHHILKQSMRINTRRLNLPLITLGRHMRMNDFDAYPIATRPFVIFGENISAYGVRTGISIKPVSDMRLTLDAYAATMNFSDGIDDFAGDIIGINMAARYNYHKIYSHIKMGTAHVTMETPALKTNNGIGVNPHGKNIYVDTEFGRRFDVNNHLQIVPFIGITGQYTYVMHMDYDVSVNAGLTMEYKYRTTEMEYAYGIRMATDTQNVNYIDAHIDITSPDDSVTLRCAMGQLHDDMGISYNMTASLIFGF